MNAKRIDRDREAVNAYIERCSQNAITYDRLVEFATDELGNGRSPLEVRCEIGRRWPGTRYSLVIRAIENAQSLL